MHSASFVVWWLHVPNMCWHPGLCRKKLVAKRCFNMFQPLFCEKTSWRFTVLDPTWLFFHYFFWWKKGWTTGGRARYACLDMLQLLVPLSSQVGYRRILRSWSSCSYNQTKNTAKKSKISSNQHLFTLTEQLNQLLLFIENNQKIPSKQQIKPVGTHFLPPFRFRFGFGFQETLLEQIIPYSHVLMTDPVAKVRGRAVDVLCSALKMVKDLPQSHAALFTEWPKGRERGGVQIDGMCDQFRLKCEVILNKNT